MLNFGILIAVTKTTYVAHRACKRGEVSWLEFPIVCSRAFIPQVERVAPWEERSSPMTLFMNGSNLVQR